MAVAVAYECEQMTSVGIWLLTSIIVASRSPRSIIVAPVVLVVVVGIRAIHGASSTNGGHPAPFGIVLVVIITRQKISRHVFDRVVALTTDQLSAVGLVDIARRAGIPVAFGAMAIAVVRHDAKRLVLMKSNLKEDRRDKNKAIR